MLLFSTILDIEKSLTKDSFIKLVLEWNQRKSLMRVMLLKRYQVEW